MAELKAEVMDAETMQRTIVRMAHEILEGNHGVDNLALVGIVRRGATLAGMLAEQIEQIEGVRPPLGSLDISFYRDDVSRAIVPVLHKTQIEFPVDNTNIVLVDDVLYTGRTVRSALDALMDFGRPARIRLAVMADRGHRELPIRADYVGKNVPSSHDEDVRVCLPELDGHMGIEIWDVRGGEAGVAGKE
jgi:pyrimidine operon attenuation protein/uracil phosphoribosyltransferase